MDLVRRFLPALAVLAFLPGNSVLAASQSPACTYLQGLFAAEGPPLFLPSYPTVQAGPLYNTAYLYDDAIAAIALVGCGDITRAKRIGDAILGALEHDRFWHDGRLRNAYAAGPVADPVKLSGWWEPKQQRWLEDSYQVGSDSGNMAWAMLALLALDRAGAGPQYRAVAEKIGTYVTAQADPRGPGGYKGGTIGWEPTPTPITWKSAEHNTDLAAAFSRLAESGSKWSAHATEAVRMVAAMHDPSCACIRAGTGEDGVTRNPTLALDAQIWPLLALPGKFAADGTDVMAMADAKLTADGGYSYGEARGGLWTEGTAYVALLWRLAGDEDKAAPLMKAVDAQHSSAGYVATNVERLPTGFDDAANPGHERFYYMLPHLAAAAWAALAEQKFNPFTATSSLP